MRNKLKYIIVSKSSGNSDNESKDSLSFLDFSEKYQKHFNESLADFASSLLENSNGINHRWNSDQIRLIAERMGIILNESVNLYDLTYLSNLAYSRFYSSFLSDEDSCVKYAFMAMKDNDSVLSNWVNSLADSVHIDWTKFY